MRFHLCLAIGFVAGRLPIFAAPLADTQVLTEDGQRVEFEISHEEVHKGRLAHRIGAQKSAEDVRATAKGEVGSDLVLYPKGEVHDESTRRLLTKQVAVHLAPGVDPARLAATGMKVVRSFGADRRWWLMESGPEPGSALEAEPLLRKLAGVDRVEVQLARQRQLRNTVPNDSFFGKQWHLLNSGQGGGVPGVDVNISRVWDTYRGAGVVIGIVDDGLERSHPDLIQNYSSALSFDFNFNDGDPEPPAFSGDDHGTACAGVAAARGNNGKGVAGAAFEATLAGLRLISRPTTDADEAEAFSFHQDEIHIKSNSWGPFDNAKILDGPGPLTLAAFEESVTNGRNGKGTIITWAAGNGRDLGDNSNYDGYANQPETIAVGAIGNDGEIPYYSESGANIVVVAPSNGGPLSITTVDRKGVDGYNSGNSFFDLPDDNYTENFGGTSSACPLAAGCIALMLQANPNLGWRDVQEILIRTARKVDAQDSDWIDNAAGFHFNHKYGAGLIDTDKAVTMALGWTNLGPRVSTAQEEFYPAEIIPDNNPTGVTHEFVFNESAFRVEHVCVTVEAKHGARGQLQVELESPSGTRSIVAPARRRDKGNNYKNFTFMSVRHWGENAAGTWKVRVLDTKRKNVGTLLHLKVELFGAQKASGIVADGAVLSSESKPDGFYNPGEQVTVEFGIKNVTEEPIDLGNVQLDMSGGVRSPSAAVAAGTINPGETKSFPSTFTVGSRAGETIKARLWLGGDLGSVTFPLKVGIELASPLTLTFNGLVTIPEKGTSGSANAYPAFVTSPFLGIPVGSQPTVTDVSVKLKGLTHTRSEDLDILLVHASTGRSVVLMSDAGAGPVMGDLTFSDSAPAKLTAAPIVPGSYRPTNLGATIDRFPKPAPHAPYGTTLSALAGVNPVDQWLLYIQDDKGNFTGTLSSWEITIHYVY